MSMEIVITYEKYVDVNNAPCVSDRLCASHSNWEPHPDLDFGGLFDIPAGIEKCENCKYWRVMSEKRTHVEVYTLPVVACARMDVLTKAGITPCLTVTKSSIVICE